jgi:hypothetical protein
MISPAAFSLVTKTSASLVTAVVRDGAAGKFVEYV